MQLHFSNFTSKNIDFLQKVLIDINVGVTLQYIPLLACYRFSHFFCNYL